jgi:hypothetical protein
MLEDLAQMGEVVSDDNYRSIIIGLLPVSYDNFLTSITNQLNPSPITVHIVKMTVSGTTIPAHDIVVTPPKITPDRLVKTLGQEADRRALRAGTPKKEQSDVAFSTETSSKGGKRKTSCVCFNCGKKGHKKADCWAKNGGKEGQGPKQGKGKGSEKAVDAKTADDDDGLAMWTAIVEDDGDDVLVGDSEASLSSAEEEIYQRDILG